MDNLEMELAALDLRRGREKVDAIGRYCSEMQLFDHLYSMIPSSQVRRRGSILWVLAHAVYDRKWTPSNDEMEELLRRLEQESDVMSKRCILDIFQYAALPEGRLGVLADVCIGFIRDPKETIAVRAFAITVLMRIISQYHDLYGEVKDLLEELSRHGSPAIRVRAKRAIASMDKIS